MSHSVFLRTALVLSMIIAMSTGIVAADLVLNHQGRLLDASDQPVNGTVSVTYRIFDAPTGGTQLWSETHPTVTVTAGQFDAILGSVTPLSPEVFRGVSGGMGALTNPRYLEITVNGSTITPRTQLVAAPYAVGANSVSGDIQTAPGALHMTTVGGSGTQQVDALSTQESATLRAINTKGTGAVVRVTCLSNDSATVTTEIDQNGDGTSENSTSLFCKSTTSGVKVVTVKGTAISRVQATTNDSSLVATGYDQNGDGVLESSAKEISSTNGSTHTLLGGHSGSTTGTIRMQATQDSAVSILEADSDGDGVADCSAKQKGSSSGITHTLLGGHSGSTTGTIRMQATKDSAVSYLELDADGDGIAECSSKEKSTPTGISHTLLGGHSGSTTGTIRMQASGAGPARPSSSILLSADLDGDGIMENTTTQSCDSSGSRMLLAGTTSVVGSGGSASYKAINTKGTGATLRSFTGGADSSKASILLEADVNGDGIDDNVVTQSSGDTGASLAVSARGPRQTVSLDGTYGKSSARCATDVNGDGISETAVAQSSDSVGASLTINARGPRQTVSLDGTYGKSSTRCATDVNGDGNSETAISQNSDSAGASLSISARGPRQTVSLDGTYDHSSTRCATDADNDGIAETEITQYCDSIAAQLAVKVKNGGVIKGGITVNNGNRVMNSMDSDGKAYVDSTLGVGVAATHKIDVAGGAYCDGTNWVNASDKNSKENFEKIDGKELLEKIEQLQISQWNYKADNDHTKHIGPTAQDFKATFGVGADDKSISTIDPSGIALAAIKELYQQLKSKDQEVLELKSEMAILKKELAKKK